MLEAMGPAAQRHEELMAALSAETKAEVIKPPTEFDFIQTAKAFEEADKDEDGLLILSEYLVFASLVLANFEQKYKEKPAHTEDDHKQMYKALNMFDPSCEGITLQDIDKMK